MVVRTAAAVHHHLAQHHLGIDDAGIRRACEPHAASSRIGVQSAPLDQHAPIPVLRQRHALRGAPQPHHRAALIAFDADALRQGDREIERRDQIAGVRGALEPLLRVERLRRDIPGHDEVGQVRLRGRVAHLRCPLEPVRRRLGIDSDAGPGEIELRQHSRRARVPLLGGALQPVCRLGVIGRQLAAPGMEMPDQCGGLGVAGIRGAPQPGFSGDEIALDPMPAQQRKPPARLSLPDALFGGDAEKLRGGREVARDADPELRHCSQHIDGVAQAGGGGLADLSRRLALARFVARRTQQRQAEPKRTLRTSHARGVAIQLLRLPQVAQRFRAEGQDVSEQRLRLGRAALRRQPRPAQRRVVIRLGRLVLRKERRDRTAGL